MGTGAAGREAFVWYWDTGMEGLGDLPGGEVASAANAVSGDGRVVVGVAKTEAGDTAFVWTEATGMRSIEDALILQGVAIDEGWSLLAASGVSSDGLTVVGEGRDPQSYPQGWIAYLPEPSYACAAAALALAALTRRSRRVPS
jgi:probable HAF family extracellular repeat protein